MCTVFSIMRIYKCILARSVPIQEFTYSVVLTTYVLCMRISGWFYGGVPPSSGKLTEAHCPHQSWDFALLLAISTTFSNNTKCNHISNVSLLLKVERIRSGIQDSVDLMKHCHQIFDGLTSAFQLEVTLYLLIRCGLTVKEVVSLLV